MKKLKNKPKKEGVSYWLSYSDMMAALILVLVLLLSISIFESKKEIEGKQAKIAEQERQLNEIVGVKKEIIEALQKEFKNANLTVKIDSKTGTIVLDSNLRFAPNKSELMEESKKFLNVFLPKYFSVLLSEKYKDNIAEILIEGHTAKGENITYINSLTLSQGRAFAVAEYALNSSNMFKASDLEVLRKIITVNGRAYYDPIYKENGAYDDTASRRVEIKFRLKDEETIQQILNMLNED